MKRKKEDYESVQIIPGIQYKRLKKNDLIKSIERAKAGNQDAFKEILCHMHNYLCYITKEFFIQGSESQDVYQEGAIKLINVIEKFDSNKGSFTSFAQSSIRKHIITTINKEKANKRSILNNSYSLDNTTHNEDGETVLFVDLLSEKNKLSKSKFSDPIDIIQKDYERFLTKKITAVLSEMEGKVFVLRFMKSLSYKDVAIEIGLWKINKKTGEKVPDQKSVDNAIWRSRPKIKKVLEKLKLTPQTIKLCDKMIRSKKNVKNS